MHECNNERKYYVYRCFIKDTNQTFYIGKGSGNRLKSSSGRSNDFKRIRRNNNCDVEKVFENLTEDEAYQKEYETIRWYKENEPDILTNIADGGRGSKGTILSEETKGKMSLASKRMWSDPIFYQKQIEQRKDPNGIWKSEEFKKKISKLVSGEKNPNYGNHWSNEQKEHLSKIKIKLGQSKGVRNGRATKIICLETGEIFDYIELAMQKYNVPCTGSFSIALKNEIRTAAGFHWKKYSEQYSDETFRWNELVRILAKSKNHDSFICIETKEIISTKKELMDKYKISDRKIKKQLKDSNSVFVNGLVFYPADRYYFEFISKQEV